MTGFPIEGQASHSLVIRSLELGQSRFLFRDVTLISDLKSQNAAIFFVQGFGFEHTLFRLLEVRLERLYMPMVDLANSAKPITVNK